MHIGKQGGYLYLTRKKRQLRGAVLKIVCRTQLFSSTNFSLCQSYSGFFLFFSSMFLLSYYCCMHSVVPRIIYLHYTNLYMYQVPI